MKWFHRKCFACGHSIRPPFWDNNVLIITYLCSICEDVEITTTSKQCMGTGASSPMDSWDFFDLGLASEKLTAELNRVYLMSSERGIAVLSR